MDTKNQVADKLVIEKLNDIAKAYFNASKGNMTTARAAEKAANYCGFYCICDGGDTEIYQRDNVIVNVWIGSNKFGDGLDGFDDQVEWYTEPDDY